MNCLECRELLQRRLDGEQVSDAPGLEQHLSQCATCREQHGGALRMVTVLQKLPKPTSPAGFAGRIVAEVLDDRRRRRQKMRRRVFVTMALAASVLVMLLAAYAWLPREQGPQKQPLVVKVDPKKMDVPHVPQPEPRNALDRMAEATRDHAKVVLAAANLDGVEKLAVNDLPVIDPGLREAGQEVSDGVRAVTMNARKAFDFFARELPMPDLAELKN
jgi:hypothetical protein